LVFLDFHGQTNVGIPCPSDRNYSLSVTSAAASFVQHSPVPASQQDSAEVASSVEHCPSHFDSSPLQQAVAADSMLQQAPSAADSLQQDPLSELQHAASSAPTDTTASASTPFAAGVVVEYLLYPAIPTRIKPAATKPIILPISSSPNTGETWSNLSKLANALGDSRCQRATMKTL
jgi:hypothetical protein